MQLPARREVLHADDDHDAEHVNESVNFQIFLISVEHSLDRTDRFWGSSLGMGEGEEESCALCGGISVPAYIAFHLKIKQ